MGVLYRNCLTLRRDSRMGLWHRGDLFSSHSLWHIRVMKSK